MILEKIIARKKEEVFDAICERPLSAVKELAAGQPGPRDFAPALLAQGHGARIIAEVKKASPSKGLIRAKFDPVAIARDYERHGAAAVSVLTEKHFFQGSPDYFAAIKHQVRLPVLRKDFLVHPYQIYESRALGADALLLIAAVLDDGQLREFLSLTRELGMEALVEVHTQGELERALAAGAAVIGINNRDLATFHTDIATTIDLAGRISAGTTVVSESGIATRDDIRRLGRAGVHAFLIGETLMRHERPGEKLAELIHA